MPRKKKQKERSPKWHDPRRSTYLCFPANSIGRKPDHKKCDELWEDYGRYCVCDCHD